MIKELDYVIHQHNAYRAGKHYDLRIVYPKKKAMASFALPKAKFPDFGERFLLIKGPDHSIKEWLGPHDDIEKGKFGGGSFDIIQIGKMELLGWGSRHITFRITEGKINGKFSLIKMGRGRRAKNWLLIRSKEKIK